MRRSQSGCNDQSIAHSNLSCANTPQLGGLIWDTLGGRRIDRQEVNERSSGGGSKANVDTRYVFEKFRRVRTFEFFVLVTYDDVQYPLDSLKCAVAQQRYRR